MALCFIFLGALGTSCSNTGNFIPDGKVAQEKFSFAWISDNHLGSFAYAEDDLRQAIEEINAIDSLDFVILTGDLTEFGVTSEFALLRQMMDSLQKPYYMVDGNHDVNWSENGTTTFENYFKGNAPRFCFDANGIRFIGCGSGPMLRMGAPHIPREEINWVKSVLDTTDTNHPIIFINHFPQFEEIANSYELTNVLKGYNVQYILCGHFHVNSTKEYNGLTSILGRSLLRRTDPMGGYNIVTVTPDSIFVAERTVKGPTHPVWFRGALTEVNRPKGEQM
ncbi:MAG: metallophosphoesterase, partial [Bacteroidales bacterium]|nr:metallophosphoesterase [Bacteroidales bacterium]